MPAVRAHIQRNNMICHGYTKKGNRCHNQSKFGLFCARHYKKMHGGIPKGCDECSEAPDCEQLKKNWVLQCQKRRAILWFRARGMTRLSKNCEH